MRPVCSLRTDRDKDHLGPSPLISTILAGATAGFVTAFFIYPLDTVKTRLQCAQDFREAGGFRGIYRGFMVLALGAMPINSIFFGSYETIKHFLEPRVSPNRASLVHMFTASFSRMLALLVRVPIEIAKQRQQVHEGPQKFSAIHIWITAYRQEGIRNGLYRGFASTLIRDTPFSFIEMPIWELLKTTVRKYTNRNKLSSIESASCGVVAGGVAGALTTPLDMVKTRIILASSSGKSQENLRVIVVLRSIYAEAGFRGMFAGVVPRVTMLTFGGFIFYTVYEETKDFFDHIFKRKCQ